MSKIQCDYTMSNANVMRKIFKVIDTIDIDNPEINIFELRWIVAKKYIRMLFDKKYQYTNDIFMWYAKSRIDHRIKVKFGHDRKCIYYVPPYMYK